MSLNKVESKTTKYVSQTKEQSPYAVISTDKKNRERLQGTTMQQKTFCVVCLILFIIPVDYFLGYMLHIYKTYGTINDIVYWIV